MRFIAILLFSLAVLWMVEPSGVRYVNTSTPTAIG